MKPEDPVFMQSFKTDLLIHEFLHLLQVCQGIHSGSCYEAVARWYRDSRYGIPSSNGLVHADTTKDTRPDTLAINRMKYVVWHALYNYQRLCAVPQDESWKNMHYGERYRSAEKELRSSPTSGKKYSPAEAVLRTTLRQVSGAITTGRARK